MMKKKALWLLLVGNLSMAFTIFTGPFLKVPDSIADFFKGFGLVLVITAFFILVKEKKASGEQSL